MLKQTLPIVVLLMLACTKDDDNNITDDPTPENAFFYFGADLSYVNEMEDCGAVYYDQAGTQKDPYQIFSEAGCNIIRLRLWHTPDWTTYSNYTDVKNSIARAKSFNMKVLLDFHYSDTWADPNNQEIPAAWLPVIDDTNVLGDSLYNYTYKTLMDLNAEGLLPDIVQIGNEINPMILQHGDIVWPINWERNSALINKGIQAVRDASAQIDTTVEIMLHIAQPENAIWWFQQATDNGVTDFDWIGLSYYPIWSDYDLPYVGEPIKQLIDTYSKKLMVVETAYPFTLEDIDAANNILNSDAAVTGIPISPEGQLYFLEDLKIQIQDAGGEGLIYWEPAWVSTPCFTLWAQGSHWDNATLFDHTNTANIGMNFYNGSK